MEQDLIEDFEPGQGWGDPSERLAAPFPSSSLDPMGLTVQEGTNRTPVSTEDKRAIIGDKLLAWIANKYPEPIVEDEGWKNCVESHVVYKSGRSLRQCGTFWTVRRCTGCGEHDKFWNRCDLVVCPSCAKRAATNRLRSLDWLIKEMEQPKHVVVTFKNVGRLTRDYLRWCVGTLKKLRRQPFAQGWRGGFWAMEITNKGSGWHVHFHLLVDSPWFPQKELSLALAYLTGGESYVVWVEDATRSGAMEKLPQYIASYSFKGNKIETWSGDKLAQFVMALKGTRTFAVFGTLYKRRSEFSAWIKSCKEQFNRCQCGCDKFQYYSELEWFMVTELNIPPPYRTKPVPPTNCEFEFARVVSRINCVAGAGVR